jgi:hypothetical protein
MGSLRTANTKHNRAVALAVKTTKAAAAPVKKAKAKKAA